MLSIVPNVVPFSLERRLGYGRLQAAGWVDDRTVLVATRAGLWRWQPASGAAVSFAPLGATLLSVNRSAGLAAVAVECPERELIVVSLAGGREVCRLPGHDGSLIRCIALSPDGRTLASGGSDRMLRVREVAAGRDVLTLVHPGGFSSMDGNPDVVAWSPDGGRIATACTDDSRRLWVWDVATGAQLAEWTLPLPARALAFSPDGQILVAGLDFGGGTIARSDRFLAVVDVQTGDILHTPDTPAGDDGRGDDLWAVTFSPDGRFCAAAGDDGAIHIFDTRTWQRVAHLPQGRHPGEPGKRITISGLDYSPDGMHLLAVIASEVNRGTGTVQYALEAWDARAWTLAARLDDFTGSVNDLALLPGGDPLAATGEGLRRYAAGGTYTTLLPGTIHRAAASPDGRYVVVGYRSFDGRAGLLDVESGELEVPLPGITQKRINSIAFLSDSRRYVVCHDDYWLRRVGRKTAIKRLPPSEAAGVEHLTAAASADGKLALVSWRGTFTVLWGDRFEHSTPWLAHPADRSRSTAADFGPPEWASTPLSNPDWAAFATWRTYPDDCRRLNAAAFSPDGALLAIASGFHQRGCQPADRRGRVYLWRLADQHTRELVTPGENRWFEAIAWSPDGQRIAAGARNGLVCWFDARSGDWLGEFAAHGAEITALCFAADGRLVSASADGSIGIWEGE